MNKYTGIIIILGIITGFVLAVNKYIGWLNDDWLIGASFLVAGILFVLFLIDKEDKNERVVEES